MKLPFALTEFTNAKQVFFARVSEFSQNLNFIDTIRYNKYSFARHSVEPGITTSGTPWKDNDGTGLKKVICCKNFSKRCNPFHSGDIYKDFHTIFPLLLQYFAAALKKLALESR